MFVSNLKVHNITYTINNSLYCGAQIPSIAWPCVWYDYDWYEIPQYIVVCTSDRMVLYGVIWLGWVANTGNYNINTNTF